ncbi:MAG: efflux RND transporter periplasmic adaptor subunit [Phycisphaerales bacterium]|nr:efflux RND transporter periplasmic adaptor subunit [Phycisphaerales bacterium]
MNKLPRPGVAGLVSLLAVGSVAAAAVAPTPAPVRPTAPLEGFAMPLRTVTIGAPLTGTIADLVVNEGDEIAEGDILFQMDSRVAQATVSAQRVVANGTAALHRARVVLEHAERVHARLIALGDAASVAEIEDAASDVEAARAVVEEALEQQSIARAVLGREEARLAEHRVTAPVTGVVTRIILEKGSIVEAASAVLTVAQIDRLEVAIYVPASDCGGLEVGSSFTLRAGPPVGRPLPAVLASVARTIDPASQTVRCVFQIENASGELPSGFPVRLDPEAIACVDPSMTP